MNTIAYDNLRVAFGARQRPAEFLRSELVGVDLLDADDFVAGLTEGKSIVEFFHSAIPYLTFLSDDAAIFHLPDFLQIIADDRSKLVTVIFSLDTDFGRRVLSNLTTGERTAVLDLLGSLKMVEEHEVMRKLIGEFEKLLKEPSQSPEPKRTVVRSLVQSRTPRGSA